MGGVCQSDLTHGADQRKRQQEWRDSNSWHESGEALAWDMKTSELVRGALR